MIMYFLYIIVLACVIIPISIYFGRSNETRKSMTDEEQIIEGHLDTDVVTFEYGGETIKMPFAMKMDFDELTRKDKRDFIRRSKTVKMTEKEISEKCTPYTF